MLKEIILLEVTCSFCHKPIQLEVTKEQLDKYKNGALIQEAFPHLTPAERELIVSRMCGDCWNQLFK